MKLQAFVAVMSGLVASSHAPAQFGAGTGGIVSLWETNCQRCHGERGQGGGAGTRTLLGKDGKEVGGWGGVEAAWGMTTDKAHFEAIKLGVPDAGMEAFGETLTDPQIWALVAYIRELQEAERRNRVPTPTPRNAERGRAIDSAHHAYIVEPVVTRGLDVPWSVEFMPDGQLLIADRPGELRLYDPAARKLGPPVRGTPEVRNRGQGGLMDVALHPEFAGNGWVYLSFSHSMKRDGRDVGMTKLVRGRLTPVGGEDPLTLKWIDEQTIFEARPEHYLPTDLHFGCRIVFPPGESPTDGKRHLFFCIGERGRGEHAQELARPNGKIHRVFDDGSIPSDNPFVGRDDAYSSIWSFGHRNPQGLTFDAAGNLWDTEHGPRGGDELNLVQRGRNYGWPVVSNGINYNGSPYKTPWPAVGSAEADAAGGFVPPLFCWSPSIGVCGLDTVRGDAFPRWRGDLVAGGLSGENVDRLRIEWSEGAPRVLEREELVRGLGRVRDVAVAPDGMIYIVLNGPDRVVRLLPAETTDP